MLPSKMVTNAIVVYDHSAGDTKTDRMTALAGSTGMSAGVRARELAFVNGDREFAARFVIVERRELILHFKRERNTRRVQIGGDCQIHLVASENCQVTPALSRRSDWEQTHRMKHPKVMLGWHNV
jgi:hypothetical protein